MSIVLDTAGGGSTYTAWTLAMVVVGFVLAIGVRLFKNRVKGIYESRKSSPRLFRVWGAVYVFMLFSAANFLTVNVAAGVILGTQNVEGAGTTDDPCPYTLDPLWSTDMLIFDFILHNLPLVLSFAIIAILVRDVTRPIENRWLLFLATAVMAVVVGAMYLTIPTDGKMWGDKIRKVYNIDPIPTSITLVLMQTFFIGIIVYMDH